LFDNSLQQLITMMRAEISEQVNNPKKSPIEGTVPPRSFSPAQNRKSTATPMTLAATPACVMESLHLFFTAKE
jgi:hypothetical protein